MGCLHITSPTLRSIGYSSLSLGKEELVIVDAPRLERLLCSLFEGETIRVIRAPKLKILGPLSPLIAGIEIASLVFQGMIPVSLTRSICTVKVLALKFSVPDLDTVLDVLRCFPCLEKLYIIWVKHLKTSMKNVRSRRYDPLDPVKCLETHLRVLVLENYEGSEEGVGFAKFFVLNAKVVKEILFRVNEKIDKKWMADQHRMLGLETKASQDAQFIFRKRSYFNKYFDFDIHDLSVADPFERCFVDGVDALSGEAC
uniref:Uncharacterized protein n=1 Tax=Avena sativa TaxID=4498 RepID=A0ACD5TXX1_AVESA